jgi:hypothetical protein
MLIEILADCLKAHATYKDSLHRVYPAGMINNARKQFENELKALKRCLDEMIGETHGERGTSLP